MRQWDENVANTKCIVVVRSYFKVRRYDSKLFSSQFDPTESLGEGQPKLSEKFLGFLLILLIF